MFNRIILMGRLTRDPELRHLQNGTALCKFGLACNTYAGKDRDDNVLFIDCTAWGKKAEAINDYFAKGEMIHLEGELRFQSWEDKQTGGKRSKHEVNVQNFSFLPGGQKKDTGQTTKAAKDKDYGDIPF